MEIGLGITGNTFSDKFSFLLYVLKNRWHPKLVLCIMLSCMNIHILSMFYLKIGLIIFTASFDWRNNSDEIKVGNLSLQNGLVLNIRLHFELCTLSMCAICIFSGWMAFHRQHCYRFLLIFYFKILFCIITPRLYFTQVLSGFLCTNLAIQWWWV